MFLNVGLVLSTNLCLYFRESHEQSHGFDNDGQDVASPLAYLA